MEGLKEWARSSWKSRKLSNFFGMICTAWKMDLSIEAGVLTSIIGPNGAGKSTLINLITGNLPVQSGTYSV